MNGFQLTVKANSGQLTSVRRDNGPSVSWLEPCRTDHMLDNPRTTLGTWHSKLCCQIYTDTFLFSQLRPCLAQCHTTGVGL